MAQSFQGWKLYWLDNASTDEEYAAMLGILREVDPKFEIVRERVLENIGFAGGHEQLYQMHDAEYVVLLNDDAILGSEYFAELMAVLDMNPRFGAVEGVILRWHFDNAGEVVKTDTVDTIGLRCGWSQKVQDIAAGETFSMMTMPDPVWKMAVRGVDEVFGVSGCLPMYRRSVIGEQLFDPAYFFYKEDVDVAYRIREKGFVSATVYAALAYHQRSFKKSLLHLRASYAQEFCSYRNHLWNLRKHVTRRDWFRYGVFIAGFEMVKAGFMLLKHPTIVWKVWRDLLKATSN